MLFHEIMIRLMEMLQNQFRSVYLISFLVGVQMFLHPFGWQCLHTQLLMNYQPNAFHGYLVFPQLFWLRFVDQPKLDYEHDQHFQMILLNASQTMLHLRSQNLYGAIVTHCLYLALIDFFWSSILKEQELCDSQEFKTWKFYTYHWYGWLIDWFILWIINLSWMI